jgi:hypothetical protein
MALEAGLEGRKGKDVVKLSRLVESILVSTSKGS